jgi:hypothetical protein
MKKILPFLVLLILPTLVSATDEIRINNPLSFNTFGEFLDAIINFLFNISLFLAPLMIIVGAFHFVTSEGNTEQIDTAKKIIRYTLIGFLIILLAKGLIYYFLKAFE